ncbi:major facilitator superfamily domain-containing protein [Podospora fimiseda]|uniref:2-(3-amino-3-carboxypropyl)histidine synthase subunit 2 n=1 Tax=Podospora fimiseda TaxID=252190 RepID=A0AAN7BHW6_9PEZI|nr:major facilitator superfamily domain-containing protein [Podospora fimiseda]
MTAPHSNDRTGDACLNNTVEVAPSSRHSIGLSPVPDANHYGPTTEKNPEELSRCASAATTTVDFPEGGVTGWLVVFGSFCAMFSLYGLINSAAVFESYFSTNQLKDNNPSEIGWIFSLYLFIVFFVGVQVGPIFDRFGSRMLVAVGSLMIILSLLLLSWCEKYYQIILTYSVMGGLGGAMLNCPAYGSIAHFFNVRRGLATGIASTAGGIGGVVFPIILRELLPGIGFAWSSRVLALIMVGLAIPANLFIKTRLKPHKTEKVQSVWPDFGVFKDPRFAMASAGIFFMEWGLFVPLTFIVSYAAAHGQDATESYLLLSYLNAGSVIGRVLPGILADKLGRFNVIIVTIAICLVTVVGIWLPAGHSNSALIAYAVLFGFGSGSNIGLVPVCLGQLCDHRKFGRLFSTAMMVASFGTLSSVPIGGALLGLNTNPWTAVILFSGLSGKMASELSAAPVLSTPAEYIFEQAASIPVETKRRPDNELGEIYEISRTARELKEGKWKRIGLQFPDSMLNDAPWVVQALHEELASLGRDDKESASDSAERIYILADTSYSACCVDEIAAEHADAQVVVHYGRSCLSPTSRLPVIYVFTRHELDLDSVRDSFVSEFSNKDAKIVLVADVTYQSHVPAIASSLLEQGYTNLLSTSIIHDPSGVIPNRKLVPASESSPEPPSDINLKEYSIFHISVPPTALLLALNSRVASLHIHPTPSSPFSQNFASTQRLLGRRYGRLLTLTTAGIIGILVNTLSVSNYLSSIDSIKKQIAAAGKKSYTVVVGKLNPAKLANFAEVDGWVVVGCWESSLVEDDAGFFKPVITPFELEVALKSDEERVWSGEWWGGIEGVKDPEVKDEKKSEEKEEANGNGLVDGEGYDDDSEEESAPPEFDLRTGKLVSHSRPMRVKTEKKDSNNGDGKAEEEAPKPKASGALTLRQKAGDLAMVNGVVSPGAEYLRSQRTWQGLGSDYNTEESSTAIEEGRRGVARGYKVGEGERR